MNLDLDIASVRTVESVSVHAPPRVLLEPLPTPGEFLLKLDNSSLEVFTTCPRAAWHKLVLRREAQARNAALTFGGAIHEGLEQYCKWQYEHGRYDSPEQEAFEHSQSVERQQQAILSFFANNPLPSNIVDDYRTVQNALAIMEAYRFRASLPDYGWQILDDASGPIIERAYELPLGTLEVDAEMEMPWQRIHSNIQPQASGKYLVKRVHVAWCGRVDLVAHCNGAARIIDHKTTSIAGDNFVQDFQISNQTLGYVWAAKQLWPEHDVKGFCLNAIHFKKPTGTGPITEPGPRGGPPALSFFRAYFDYSAERLDQWADNALTIVEDFVHCLVRDSFPMHTKWCFGKYGPCPYHPVCTIDDAQTRLHLLMSDAFRPVTWDPVRGR